MRIILCIVLRLKYAKTRIVDQELFQGIRKKSRVRFQGNSKKIDSTKRKIINIINYNFALVHYLRISTTTTIKQNISQHYI